MKKGFSLIEILITIFLISIFTWMFSLWLRQSSYSFQKIEKYYLEDKGKVIEKFNLAEGETTVLTPNIMLKKFTVNGRTFEYLKFQE